MTCTPKILFTLFVLAIGLDYAQGQAYCALRDPTAEIFELFPDADSFRSIIREISDETRSTLAGNLPFTLHHKELGYHTLYVATKNQQPLGLIHVRSEAGKWGLVEIIWALDFEAQVLDYRFQRCREKACRTLPNDLILSHLKGKSTEELEALITEKGVFRKLDDQLKSIDAGAMLANTLIRSAIKTINVTRLVWTQELKDLAQFGNDS